MPQEISGTGNSQKRGYLHSDFRIFYLTSTQPRDFQSHYHDFHKLLFFESGHVSYYIEGETYQLRPGDFILVPAGEVHRPVIHDDTPYCRLIAYISPAFFEQYQANGTDLFRIFSACSTKGSHVVRPENLQESRLYAPLQEMIYSASAADNTPQLPPDQPEVGASAALRINTLKDTHTELPVHIQYQTLYQQSLLLQLLILLALFSSGESVTYPAASGSNPQILAALSFINEHLAEDLSIDQIAAACFLNRSYLMHLFRKETGYTIGNYIAEKRLFTARTLIQNGIPVTEACHRSGFSGYTSFYRAYRKKFRESPKDARK